ncbi:3-carboxy-cis,cis-muconate cycloisomerase [Hartmannibacter diazotrophicus]|uniref:3-carboxy-cis,cis-muconate cycloisomerase n=1 Tax=Hartmannibacter diazotrophicus TaxID=1482074 RepID=A0A2C9D0U3_9HYPH|nr:3-carboxy-cis,cis-muconate cycloisomerase [Hartmannibacter diazotrophicus]SON53843.1 3-carboxy-cis,cis-muconate cycloisomerase [Hartmannibacter diazotrophicus]
MNSASSLPLLQSLTGDAEIAALFADEADLVAMLRFEAALADVEAKAGLIEMAAARRIGEVCGAFEPDWDDLRAGVVRDGVVVPALVKQLRKAVGEPHSSAVHLGATSQDVIDTSLVLRLKELVALLEARLDNLRAALDALDARSGQTAQMAHTRMQKALPFSAADRIRSWTAPLIRHRRRLDEMKLRLLCLQLGGPVGNRSSFKGKGDEIASGLAGMLGLEPSPPWQTERDGLGEFAALLALMSGSLGKFGQDVALGAQNEVGEIAVAGGGGSSAMPHKTNPVSAELLVTLARFNAGLSGTLMQALVHENERSGAAWTLEWMVLPQMAEATGAGLRIALDLVGRLSFRSPHEDF